MTHNKRLKSASLPVEASEHIARLGDRVRIARKRRGLTLEDTASRMFVTRKTLARLEKGDPAVSMSVFVSALFVLGLDKTLLEVASPEHDAVGIRRERSRLPVRVRASKSDAPPDF